jgi:hypothetical protein
MDLKREPLVVSGAAVALAQAVLTAVVLMGWWNITAEQAAAWTGVIALAGTFAVVAFTRGKVTPMLDPRNDDGEAMYAIVDLDDLDY